MMIRYKSVFVLALLALPMVSFAQDDDALEEVIVTGS